MVKIIKNPIIDRVLYIPGSAGFLPSTVPSLSFLIPHRRFFFWTLAVVVTFGDIARDKGDNPHTHTNGDEFQPTCSSKLY